MITKDSSRAKLTRRPRSPRVSKDVGKNSVRLSLSTGSEQDSSATAPPPSLSAAFVMSLLAGAAVLPLRQLSAMMMTKCPANVIC